MPWYVTAALAALAWASIVALVIALGCSATQGDRDNAERERAPKKEGLDGW